MTGKAITVKTIVDEEIIPLLKAMTKLSGVITAYSCAGHKDRDVPYVMFWCTNKRSLKKIIKVACKSNYTHVEVDYHKGDCTDWYKDEFRYNLQFKSEKLSVARKAIEEFIEGLK